ncbi:MAG: DNA topoisomerase III [Myxococcales bacterium]|nr:DNA topoisomerase III [Myxococcales bacterium]
MQLVIAEKPSVARDLARVLGVRGGGGKHALEGEQFVITWCIGHLVELEEPAAYDPAWKAWRLDRLPMLPQQFQLRGSKHALPQLRAVETLLRDRSFAAVINACDAGREGELIFRYVYQHAGSRLPIRRLWISSLTDDAIRKGFAALRPGQDYDRLGDAARSRSEADWLVGMNATRAITAKGREAGHDALYSIGRVQTPTLAMLVERERAIQAFVPRPYWEVTAALRTEEGAPVPARWRFERAARLGTAELAEQIAARDRAEPAAVVELVRSRTVREPPPQLFDLTSLQRTANRRYGFSAQRTLEIAQALYERHKLITYPRTDSRHLSADVAAELTPAFTALAAVPAYARFAQPLLDTPPRPNRRIVDDAKVHDHHAIIPTGTRIVREALDRDLARVFDLIAIRFLGAFYPDAEIAVTEAWLRTGPATGAPPTGTFDTELILGALPPLPDRYLARGRVRLVAGWQEVAGIGPEGTARPRAGEARDDARDGEDEREPTGMLPVLVEGQRLTGTYTPVAKETKPPLRFTEATLLGAMEGAGRAMDDEAMRAAMKDTGLGTPATRASIIETLLRRTYIERDQKWLVPTPTGIGLISAIPVPSLASPELTGGWEARLAAIARGEDTRAAFMGDIARYVSGIVDAIRGASPPPAPPPGSAPAAAWRGKDAQAKSARGDRRFPDRAQHAEPARGSGAAAARGEGARASAPRGSASRGPAPRASAPKASAPRAAAPRASASPPRPAAASSIERTRVVAPKVAKGESPTSEVLTCPRCKRGTLITGARGWGCSRWNEGCGFVVWFETAGRRLTATQLRELVTKGKTRKAAFAGGEGRLVLDPGITGGARFERG